MFVPCEDVSRRVFGQRLAGIASAFVLSLVAWRAAHAATFSANDRRCATCSFWRGKRRLTADGKRVIVPDDERGICSNGQSPLFNKVTFPGSVYPDGHKTWSEIQNFKK